MADYTIKKNESLSKIRARLLGRYGLPIDLSTASEVRFYSRLDDSSENDIDGALCEVVSAQDGDITLPSETHSQVGGYEGWFKIIWSTGDPDYVPSRGYLIGEVEDSWEV